MVFLPHGKRGLQVFYFVTKSTVDFINRPSRLRLWGRSIGRELRAGSWYVFIYFWDSY